HGLDVIVGFRIAAGHNAGAGTGTLLSAGDAATHKMKPFFFHELDTPQRIRIMRITTVDNDIPFFEEWEQIMDDIVYGFTCRYEHHHSPGFFKQLDHLRQRSDTFDRRSGSCRGLESRPFSCIFIKADYWKAMISHVE